MIKQGDIILLGNHRLMCGDATNGEDVKKLFRGATPNLMVTDPPYGVDYNPAWRDEKLGCFAKERILNDGQADWTEAWRLFPGNVAYVWHAGKYASIVQNSLERVDFQIRSQIIWAKSHFAISRGHYHWQHEPCWYAVRKKGTANWQGDRKQRTVWQLDRDKERTGHATQKPIGGMSRPILNHTVEGDGAYDPFGGSGTTLIACEILNRQCYMMGLSPVWCQVIIDRWEKMTGRKGIRYGNEGEGG